MALLSCLSVALKRELPGSTSQLGIVRQCLCSGLGLPSTRVQLVQDVSVHSCKPWKSFSSSGKPAEDTNEPYYVTVSRDSSEVDHLFRAE